MLIADGGGGYGGTDWNSKDVRYMWSAIADQETDKHFDVVSGWKQTADLTITHLGQVQMYRDNLASVWPPSKSPAAAAYIERLDKLIADLQATHEAASANYTAFSTVTLTLSLARNKLKPLYDQWEANEKANQAWKTEQDAKAVDPTEPPRISLPPVSSAQQEQLNNQARVIMYDLSSTVISGQSALQKPKPYDPAKFGIDEPGGRHDGSSSGSGFATPPIIPPPGAGDTLASSSQSRSSSSSGVAHISPNTHSPGLSGHMGPGGTGTGGVGAGPILGGVATNPVVSPPTSVTSPIGATAPTVPSTSVGAIPGVIAPNTTGSLRTPVGSLPTGGRLPEGTMRVGGGTPTGRAAMPSGGVIGANPGSGTIGQMPAANPSRRASVGGRPNPVGGVIGQQGGSPAGARSTGRVAGSAANSSIAAQPSSRATRRNSDDSEHTRWDPDNPWATDHGVNPVVLPPGEPGPIDPGPAIGIDR